MSALSAEKLTLWDLFGAQNVGIQQRLVKSNAATVVYCSKSTVHSVENLLSSEITAKTAARDSLLSALNAKLSNLRCNRNV